MLIEETNKNTAKNTRAKRHKQDTQTERTVETEDLDAQRAETNTKLFEDLRGLKTKQQEIMEETTSLARTLICPGTKFRYQKMDLVVVGEHTTDGWPCKLATGAARSAKTLTLRANEIVP